MKPVRAGVLVVAFCTSALAGGVHLPKGVSVPLGGGVVLPPDEDRACLPPAQEAQIQARVDAYLTAHPSPLRPISGPPLYPFFPQAGNWYQDISATGFVDLDPTPLFQDFKCEDWTYDTHAGIDCELKSFAEQAIGVPVFAVLPGTVVDRDDGHPDLNVVRAGQPANYVVLDNGSGRQTWYLHMKNGSVAVQLGQVVQAGQQLGLTASSGNSAGPHLHFESRQDGNVFEPFAGPCRPGPSGWANQPAIRRDLYLADFAPSIVDMTTAPAWPYESPRTGQFAITDNDHWLWINVHNLPADSTYRIRYVRPNGQVEFEAPTYPFNNPVSYPRAWYWFWGYYIPDMHSSAGLGVWRVQFDINGVQVIDAPVTVRTQRTSDFNSAPVALQGLAFDPPAPASTDVILCRVSTSLLYDDPDYDVVRYEYLWSVNGQVVRHVTTAALSDAIPALSAPPGALVSCTVTPHDASLAGPPSSTSVHVRGGCPADLANSAGARIPDGGVDINDLLFFLAAFEAGSSNADIDNGSNTGTPDGGVDINDLLFFLTHFEAGC